MLVEKREIVGVKSLGSGRVLGPVELDRCVLNGSALAQFAARRFEATPVDTLVAVTPKQSKHFATRLAELEVLRAEGLAD